MRVVKYKKNNANSDPFIKITDTIAKPASAEELSHDALGITSPNLHRSVDEDSKQSPDEELPTSYLIAKRGTNSYVLVSRGFHDEDSEISEVP